MKKTFIFLFIIGMFSCNSSQKSNGFARSYDGPWKIGTQAGVDIVTELDKAWSNKDFEKMKMFFDDSATFLFAEGDRFNSVNGFIDHIKNQMGDDDANWTYDWAVAVDESPGEGGEWVNAGFTSDISKTNKDTSKIHYSEWYYIEDGKIKLWNQTRRIILSK